MMHAIPEGPIAATAKARGVSVVGGDRGVTSGTVGLLGVIFTHAMRNKFRADNMVRGVMGFADGWPGRQLTGLATAVLARPWRMR